MIIIAEDFKKEYGNCYVDIFNYLDNGAIKDFLRLCILYRFGGSIVTLIMNH